VLLAAVGLAFWLLVRADAATLTVVFALAGVNGALSALRRPAQWKLAARIAGGVARSNSMGVVANQLSLFIAPSLAWLIAGGPGGSLRASWSMRCRFWCSSR
jgi:hypothetical protein